MKNIFKRATALLLSLLMVFSVCSTALIVYAVDGSDDGTNSTLNSPLYLIPDTNDNGEIDYVALGDSMTNGFGMGDYYLFMQRHEKEGHEHDWSCTVCSRDHTNPPEAGGDQNAINEWAYHCPYSPICDVCMLPNNLDYPYIYDLWDNNNWGYLANASQAYPTLVAEALNELTGKTVNQLNMAISGFRAEELRFMLDMDYANGKYDGYTKKYYTQDALPGGGNGDNRTANVYYNAISNPNTYVSPYAAELNDKVNADRGDGQPYWRNFYLPLAPEGQYWDHDMARVHAHYNVAVTGADLITIALGTNNFGTGVQGSIYRAIKHHTGAELGDVYDFGYDLDALMEEFPKLKAMYPEVEAKILATVAETSLVKDMGFCEDCIKDIVRTYAYGILGFMANYEKSLELIRELNPNATIVVVGAMNMEEGLTFTMNGKTINFGDAYGTLINFGNRWLADHVSDMDNVYYSEIDKPLDLLVNDMAKGKWNDFMVGHMAMGFAEPAEVDWWTSDQANWLHSRISRSTGIIRVANTFGLHHEGVLNAVAEYNAGVTTALDAYATQIVNKYAGEKTFILWWNKAETVDAEYAKKSMRLYAMAMQFLDALEMATKKKSINFDNVMELLDKDGYMIIFEDLERLDDADVQDLLYFYARMKFTEGSGVHPSATGHKDIADDIILTLLTGRSGKEDAEQKEEELKDLAKDAMLSYLKGKYPNVFKSLSGASSISEMDDLARIIKLMKMSKSESLNGVDLDKLEANLRDALRRFDERKSDEEVAKAQEDVKAIANLIWALGTAVTGTSYTVNENSYYVSFGDSNVNGLGLEGYKETNNEQNNLNGIGQYIEDAAPALLAQELFGENWKSQFAPYAQGGIRVEDVYYILGGKITPDQYYYDRVEDILLKGTVEATRDDYIATLKKADLISFTIGGGNVSTFVGYQIEQAAAGKTMAEMDWAKLGFTSSTITELKAMMAELVPMIDAVGLMDEYLPEGMNVENPAQFATVMIESMLYGYASYNYYYTKVVEMIREINPDAQLLLLGMFNPIDDWTVTFNYNGSEKTIDIGGIATNAMDLANMQSLMFALQNDNISFVDISETETFLDAKYPNTVPSFSDYYAGVMAENGKMTHANEAGHAYMYAQMLSAIDGDGYKEELKNLAAKVYEALNDNYLTTSEKLNYLHNGYNVAKDKGMLNKYPQIAVAEEIYLFLDSKNYITEKQTLEIILKVYGDVLESKVNKTELALYVYDELVLNNEVSAEAKADILANLYIILEANGYLAAYDTDLLEDLCVALDPYVDDAQAVEIANAIYALYKENELEAIDVIDLVYNKLIASNKDRENALDIIVAIYGVLKDTNYVGAYAAYLPILEQLCVALDSNTTDEEALDIVDYLYTAIVNKNVDKAAIADFIYDLYINNANKTDAQKLEVINAVYGVLKANGYLNDYNTDLIEDLCVALDPYFTDAQAIELAKYIYASMDDIDEMQIAKDLYKNYLLAEQNVDTRIDIICKVFAVINKYYNLKANSTIAMIENIGRELVVEKKSVSKLQAFTIVHFVYLAYVNDDMIDSTEFRLITNIAYYGILGIPKAKRSAPAVTGLDFTNFNFTWDDIVNAYTPEDSEEIDYNALATDVAKAVQSDSETEVSATTKIEIIQTVYTGIKETAPEIIDSNPQVEAVGELFMDLTTPDAETGKTLITDEQAAVILDSAFTNFVAPEEVDTEKAVEEVTKVVVEQIILNPEVDVEQSEKIVEKVFATLEQLGSGSENEGEGDAGEGEGEGDDSGNTGSGAGESQKPTTPSYTKEIIIVKGIINNLMAEGLLTSAQASAIFNMIYDEFRGDMDVIKIVKFVYETLFRADIDDAAKIKIIVALYKAITTDTDYLDAYAEYFAIVEELCAKPAFAKVSAKQMFAIVDYIYEHMLDKDDFAVKAFVDFIWNTVFGNIKPRGGLTAADFEAFTAAEKLDILKACFEVLEEQNLLTDIPAASSIIDLYNDIRDDETLSDEKLHDLIDKVVDVYVETPDTALSPEMIANVAKDVVESVMADESIPLENKVNLIGKVVDTLDKVAGDGTLGDVIPDIPSIPDIDLTIVNQIIAKLDAEGILSKDTANVLVGDLTSLLLKADYSTTEGLAKLADDAFDVILAKGFTAEQAAKIAYSVVEFLIKEGYADDAIDTYVEPYYQIALKYVLTAQNIELANYYIDLVTKAVNDAMVAVNDYAVTTPEFIAVKNALVAELAEVLNTLNEAKTILATNGLKDLKTVMKTVISLKDDLDAHITKVAILANELGIAGNYAIGQLMNIAQNYNTIAQGYIDNAYAWIVENVKGINQGYIDIVNEIVATVAKFDSALAQAVYGLMMDAPSEAIALIALYGEDAIYTLCGNAADVANDLYVAASNLVLLLKDYGIKIYSAIVNDPTCKALQDQIEALNAQLQALTAAAKTAPAAQAAAIYAQIEEIKAYGMDLADMFYKAAIAAVYAVDPIAGNALDDAIEAITNAAALVTGAAGNYADWLTGKAGELSGKIVDIFVNNWNNFADIALGRIMQIIESLKEPETYYSILDKIVEEALKVAPQLDAKIRDYLNSTNPEFVAFIERHEPYLSGIVQKYGPEALGAIGVALATYGPELGEYLIENADVILAGIVEFVEKNNVQIVAVLQLYAESIGLYDKVSGEITILTEKLAQLKAEITKQLNIINNEICPEIAELNEQLKVATAPQQAIILEQIKILEAKKQQLEQYIAQAQASMVQVSETIAQLAQKQQAFTVALGNLGSALKTLAVVGVENGTGEVQKALNAAAYALYDLVNVVSGDLADQIDNLIEMAKKFLDDSYNSAIKTDYTIDPESLFVAFGNNTAAAEAFVALLNEAIKAEGYNYTIDYANNADANAKITDLLAAIATDSSVVKNADLISIGYSYDKIAEETLDIFFDLLIRGETNTDTNADWNKLLGSEIGKEVVNLLAEIEVELVANGLKVTLGEIIPNLAALVADGKAISDAAMAALEHFAYYAVEYAVLAPQAIALINQINPDAIIILNAISNPISGASIDLNLADYGIDMNIEFTFGDYLDYVVDAIYVESVAIAAANNNVVFAPTTEIETKFTNFVIDSETFPILFATILDEADHITIDAAEGAEDYIAQKMYEALNITVEPNILRGDVNGDGEVNNHDAYLLLRHALAPEFYVINQSGDMNGDGEVNNHDAYLLLRHALAPEFYPLS